MKLGTRATPSWASSLLKPAAERKRIRKQALELNRAYADPSRRFKNWKLPEDLLREIGYCIGDTVAPREGSGGNQQITAAIKTDNGRLFVRLSNGTLIPGSTLRKSYIRVSG
jgi:hypothetical protein